MQVPQDTQDSAKSCPHALPVIARLPKPPIKFGISDQKETDNSGSEDDQPLAKLKMTKKNTSTKQYLVKIYFRTW